MYTLDTNTIIYYLKGEIFVASFLESILASNEPLYISAVTELELFSFSQLTKKEEQQIDNLLQTLNIIPVDSQIARLAGFLRANYKIKTPDSIIAATAIFTGTTLITRNTKDFEEISLLNLQAI